jgi:hypothetical protein
MSNDVEKGLPRELRRLLIVILAIVAVIEIALWTGVATGLFSHSKTQVNSKP